MKRLLVLSLALLLLLCSCSRGHKFQRTEAGNGYIDQKTDLTYTMLDISFEAAVQGEAVGTFTDKKRDITVTFHEIPSLEPTLFLADEDRNVYYAGEGVLDPAAWRIEAALVCEGDGTAIVERSRFTAEANAPTVEKIRDLWFEGEEANFLSLKAADKMYSIKLVSKDHPNLYYCFSFLAFDEGESYFYHAVSHRSVVVPADLVKQLRASEVA